MGTAGLNNNTKKKMVLASLAAQQQQQQQPMLKVLETQAAKTKTTVAYYLPGEDLAYISTFHGENLTLAQFKQLITKKGGNFR